MDNLGKENFWNEIHERFPNVVDLFCRWIDDYKKEVEWTRLFATGIKFHDIPYELQMGIMNRFFIESFAGKEEFNLPSKAEAYRNEMIQTLELLNRRLIPLGPKKK